MKCGGVNLDGANFCSKCGSPFGAVASTPTTPRPTSQTPKPNPPKRKVNSPYAPAVIPLQKAVQDTGEIKAAIEDEDDENPGESLDFVPEVEGLVFERIESDVVQKVTFGQLMAEAKVQQK